MYQPSPVHIQAMSQTASTQVPPCANEKGHIMSYCLIGKQHYSKSYKKPCSI